MKELLLGNEAIARGAWEAGVKFAAGYPGTPSTEILETLAKKYPEIDAQWSANEKVAFEEGMGAAIGGLRVLVTMKMVGLNVAADAFMVFPYSGTNGGFVVISADDPGMHSSQNEQDNRYLALMAKVPVLEPSDAQECKDFIKLGMEISEQFSVPVMVRTTTRLAHHKGLVEMGERVEAPQREFVPDPRRFSVPIYRTLLRPGVEKRLEALRAYAEITPINRIEWGVTSQGAGDPSSTARRPVGFVTCSIAYQYVREVMPEASVFRLGLTHPLPQRALQAFCAAHETVYVVEEGEPFIEEAMKAMGITNLVGKRLFGVIGEYSPERIARAIGVSVPEKPDYSQEITLLPRPPMFCVGCGHRTVFDTLRQLKVTVAGDIGCYTMGALPPYEASHTTFCMGASIGTAFGLERAGHRRTVAIIGDSTFVHAGIPSLIDAVYNGSSLTLIILDNATTGMTGQQPHPAAGTTLRGKPAPKLDLEGLVRAAGVKQVQVVDTWQRRDVVRAIREAVSYEGPAVVIAQGPCMRLPEMKLSERGEKPYFVDEAVCTKCDACFKVWCPAITRTAQGFPVIDALECTACTVCAQVCPADAIGPMGGGCP
ncbi:MAG TPA: indolepyruvate ferredoxin oxidoreductase subunit alpha [Anaerolineales bacterium]|nr:indolepyruvate ferredoxin oxidoreductase subunit alpha [Anaerolineales bacterium]